MESSFPLTNEKYARKEYLDSAKGIGIIAVMLGHSCGLPVILTLITGFYMPLFFVISGMTTKFSSLCSGGDYSGRKNCW